MAKVQYGNNIAASYTHWLDTGLSGESVSVWYSTERQDEAWDHFLNAIPLGEFQQTGCWAKVKQTDGWKSFRVVLTCHQKFIGGFQVLWRKSRSFQIGYISKGPVLEKESKEAMVIILELIERAARHLRLIALIIHPPEKSRLGSSLIAQANFFLNRWMGIVTATLMVDVSKGMEAVEARMRRDRRQKLRKAHLNKVSIREGNEKDIGTFFQLMLETCKRQGTQPNPSSELALKALWENAQAFGGCRLTLAEHNGRSIAGQFCIPFGKVLRMWKKGSLPEYLRLHPVEMLYQETMSWAYLNGYQCCDLIELDRNIAEALLNGFPLTEQQKKSRDTFNLGFGGYPVILPDAFIHFPNSILSHSYRLLSKNIFITQYLKKLADRLN